MLSTDGYGAGEGQSLERPFGHADPAALASWAGATAHWPGRTDPGGSLGLDYYCTRDFANNIGAEIMGRNKFGPQRGPWTDDGWKGWWGDDPVFHTPVFVLTHYPRPSLEMDGGTTFHFVTDGFDAAFEQATAVAGDRGVDIAGGASTVRQALAAGVVDELTLDIAPVLLGEGERLFDGLAGLGLTPVETLHSPHATHVRYRVERRSGAAQPAQ